MIKYEAYMKKQREKIYKLKRSFLENRDIVEKVTSKFPSDGYIYLDHEKDEYYKYAPVNLSYKEVEKILELDDRILKLKKKSVFINLFRIIFVLVFLIGFIVGIVEAKSSHSFLTFITVLFNYTIISLLFLGIAEVMRMLDEIRRK